MTVDRNTQMYTLTYRYKFGKQNTCI